MISVTPQTDVPPKPVKVLFVEDEVLLRLMMADVLREEGFQWSTAAAWPGGARAQQGLNRNVPGGSYEIIRKLPESRGEFEYRIKSMNEPHDRVVQESELRAV